MQGNIWGILGNDMRTDIGNGRVADIGRDALGALKPS